MGLLFVTFANDIWLLNSNCFIIMTKVVVEMVLVMMLEVKVVMIVEVVMVIIVMMMVMVHYDFDDNGGDYFGEDGGDAY